MSEFRNPPMGLVEQHHAQVSAQYGKVKEAEGQLDHVRRELDGLLNLGDSIIPDDVIKASGRLVGHGLGAERMAELLATMPAAGGAPLSEWVKSHDLDVKRREAQMMGIKNIMGHHLALSGLRVLAADHIRQTAMMGGLQGARPAAPIESGGLAIENPAGSGTA